MIEDIRNNYTTSRVTRSVAVAVAPSTKRHHPSLQSRLKKRWLKVSREVVAKYRQLNLAQRIVAWALLALLIVSSGIQIVQPLVSQKQYDLSKTAENLVGVSRADTAKYLSLSQDKKSYTFVAPESESNSGSDTEKHFGRDDSLYSTSLSLDPKQGISFTDTKTKITITALPKFSVSEGQKVKGDHIVYPSGATQLVYTHKYDGLKENIIVPSKGALKKSYEFELRLPSGVEAKLMQDGGIGIYSADISLYGDISFGTDKDREKMDKAREKSQKTNLVATLPAPLVQDAKGTDFGNKATFELSQKTVKKLKVEQKDIPAEVQEKMAAQATNVYNLSIVPKNVKDLDFPVAIDPTIKTTATSDFQEGEFDGITMDRSNNLVRRAPLSPGTIGAWTTDTATTANVAGSGNRVVYRNFIYDFGANTYYAPLNDSPISGSMVGSWTITNKCTSNPADAIFAYNGYMYCIIGTTTKKASYAVINEDGSLGTWVLGTTTFSTNYQLFAATAYNGYMYVLGGEHTQNNFPAADTQVADDEVQYAPINADGTVGTWATTTHMNLPRRYAMASAYNGYMYVYNGNNIDDSTVSSKIEYAPINADGTLGNWTTSPYTMQLTAGRTGGSGGIYQGYLYMWGGWDPINTVEFTQINADGSIGPLQSTSAFSNGRGGSHGGPIYNGYLFVIGGNKNNGAISYDDIQYAKVDTIGGTGVASTDSSTFTTARGGHGTVVANGYIYIVGGCSVTVVNCDTNGEVLSTVYMASINSNGTIGSWSSQNALPSARGGLMTTFYNNTIYALGGAGPCGGLGAFSGQCTQTYYASVNPSTGTVSGWSSGTVLPAAKSRGVAAAYNGYIYAMGGRNGTNAIVNTVYYMAADEAGNIAGSWVSASLNDTLEFPAATVYGGYMYVASGWNGTTVRTSVDYTAIASNGSFSGWTTGPSLVNARDGGTLAAYNGYMYFAGGLNYSTIEYASIGSNGAPGTFANSPNSLNTGYRRNGSGMVYNGRLYVAGGDNSSAAPVNSVDVVPINNGGSGTLGTWTSKTPSLPAVRGNNPGVALYNGYLYVAGGRTTGGSDNTTVYYASLSDEGTLGSWSTTTALPTAITGIPLVAYHGYIYAVGANTSCGKQVLYNTVNSNGTLGATWSQAQAADIPNFTCNVLAGVYHGRLYIFGGWAGSNGAGQCTSTVRYATIQSNGTLSGWTTSSAAFNTPRNAPSMTFYGGYVYVMGGYFSSCNAGSATFTSTVEFAKLDTDGNGTVGSFAYATALPISHGRGASVASNGYIYDVSGQDTGGNPYTTYRRAAILSGGRLGTWENGTQALITPRVDFGLVLQNGRRMFVVGGNNLAGPPTYYSSIESASVLSILRTGTYTKSFDFSGDQQFTRMLVNGSFLSDNSVTTSFARNSAATYGSAITSENVVAGTRFSNRGFSRYARTAITLDDSQSSSFPDSGGESTLTDFQLFYHAYTRNRLRGGTTLQNGDNNILDTEGP